MEEIAKSTILQPLTLQADRVDNGSNFQEIIFVCIFCDFHEKNEKKCLQHIYFNHRTIIADVQHIANLNEYLIYWRDQFKGNDNILLRYSEL